MWKHITGVIAEVIYEYMEEILSEEQKGCRRRSRGTKDQLLIDKTILKNCTFSTDIGMEFVIKKCGMLVRKRGKIAKMEGIVLPDGQVMKEIDIST